MIFRLDLGQITFNLVKNAFATQQLAFLATGSRFSALCDSGMRRDQNFEKVAYVFELFHFWNFFRLSFFSFSFLFATVIDLLLGLLAVKKTSEKASSRRAIFSMEQPGVVAGNFALSFSLNFLSIFVHI